MLGGTPKRSAISASVWFSTYFSRMASPCSGELLHGLKYLFILQPLIHGCRHVCGIAQRQCLQLRRRDTAPHSVNIKVPGDGDQPGAKAGSPPGIEPVDPPDHFQEGLLRQVLRQGDVRGQFQEEAGDIGKKQADQLFEGLPVPFLTRLYQLFNFQTATSFHPVCPLYG